ncbi:DNA cytosine methyltransferase [Kordiimonas marina]|uniref:DNA cytosine methyltransferase n=1 Tax=Kordiimonas marina TaxID=2872312 RepID=UPI001FF66968|nr:DNA cytosine methyltransferase [Kordiimonas marina]MCJ9430733.1 DNA cytosine methyltransferase [Kordiimonas marina]
MTKRSPSKNSNATVKPTAIDLFCGSGAVTLGLKQAGFDVLASVDIDPIAGKTYELNHPEVDFKLKDITQVRPERDFPDLPKRIGLLAVCAPCQPFSNRNKKRSDEDDRVELVLEAVKFARYFQPKAIFFENVPGIERHSVFAELTRKLSKLRYHVGKAYTVDAADLGVPQRRPRMVLVAAKRKQHLKKLTELGPVAIETVRDAIGDLVSPVIGQKADLKDPLHFSRRHHAITLERLKHIPKNGGSRISLPDRLVLECHKGLADNQYPDSYGRMCWEDVAPTLTTGCTDLTKGRYSHPVEDRAITLREAARLQTFPDSYKFSGNASQVACQIGNAVPPKMMAKIAERIAALIQ